MKLSRIEIKAIQDVLVDAGSKLSKEELTEACNILATLRYKYSCDNHELHRMYSDEIHGRNKTST